MNTKNKRSIFIIDDDLELSNVMERILMNIDETLDIFWTTSAEEAMLILRKRSKYYPTAPFDLMICDIFLEGNATGLELWDFCQKHYSDMKIAVISGLEEHRFNTLIKLMTPEPLSLHKPFSVQEFTLLYSALIEDTLAENLPNILT